MLHKLAFTVINATVNLKYIFVPLNNFYWGAGSKFLYLSIWRQIHSLLAQLSVVACPCRNLLLFICRHLLGQSVSGAKGAQAGLMVFSVRNVTSWLVQGKTNIFHTALSDEGLIGMIESICYMALSDQWWMVEWITLACLHPILETSFSIYSMQNDIIYILA